MKFDQYETVPQEEDEGFKADGINQTSRKELVKTYIIIALIGIILVLIPHDISRDPSKTHVVLAGIPNTSYAQLSYSREVQFTKVNEFNSGNRSQDDLSWSITPGYKSRESVIALSDSFSQALGLPTAQRWPWDKNKGIYVLEGIHVLHCVKYLRKAILNATALEPLTDPAEHLLHCIDSIRQFVVCHADDTPRYTGRLHAEINATDAVSGIGQVRMCRDWNQLIQWAAENSACYEWKPEGELGFTEADRYKSCPHGEIYW